MNYYTMQNIKEFLTLFKLSKIKKYSKKKKKFYNIPITFDIETTNIYRCLTDNSIHQANEIVKMKLFPFGKL